MTLAASAVLAAAGAAVVLSAPAASAIVCPDGTYAHDVRVAGKTITYCSLEPPVWCDPGPCEDPPTSKAPS